MKKHLLALAAFLTLAVSARATLVLSNSFGYTDGALITVSAGSPLGVWTTHSGTAGQVDVASGKVNLTELESEDVNTVITNATFPKAFTNQILYASFTVNFSGLPSGPGGYFAHFKDETTADFRCRVYAVTNASWPGQYRLGIVNGSSTTPVLVAKNLSLGTDYTVVLRFKGSTNSTIWINQNCESSVTDTADAADVPSNTWHGSTTFALRQSLSSGAGMGTLTFDNLLIATTFGEVIAAGPNPPSISAPADQSIAASTSTGPLPFSVSDCETAAGSLVVTYSSDNTTLVPNNNANIVLAGNTSSRTVTVNPVAGQQGVAHITLSVTDGDSLTTSITFTVTVGAPSISAIANQTTLTNTTTPAIPFTVGDESPATLTVTATSSDQSVVQDSDITIATVDATHRTITIKPMPDASGAVTITVTATDSTPLSASTSFKLSVYRHLGLLLGDTFTYPDGYLPSVSGGFWIRHSGTSNDSMVVSGQLRVSTTNADDVHANFTNSFFLPATSGDILYSKFDVNFAVVPRGSGGDYFAHYKDLGTSNFRARVFAETNGAATGKFRIGVANGGFIVADVPRDLNSNTTYTVVTRYVVSTATSTVWVNPHSESSPSATATDPSSPIEIDSYCFRQDGPGGSPTSGITLVDNLLVGTAFTDVSPAVAPPSPIPLSIAVSAGNAVLTWANPVFNLQSAPAPTGPWTTLWDAATGYSTPVTPAPQYFRLYFYP